MISYRRAKLCLESLVKDIKYPNLAENFNAGCPSCDQLNSSVMSFATFNFEKNYIGSLHEIYSLSEAVRKIICWEATLSFVKLEESVSKDNINGEG